MQQDVVEWLRSMTDMPLAVQEKFAMEEVDGELLALYAEQNDHVLLKQDMGLAAGRARSMQSALSAFVAGTGVYSEPEWPERRE
eukprot:SAG11_NODE_4357_length_1934_cov_1.202725_2_plen_84_part_00